MLGTLLLQQAYFHLPTALSKELMPQRTDAFFFFLLLLLLLLFLSPWNAASKRMKNHQNYCFQMCLNDINLVCVFSPKDNNLVNVVRILL